MDQVVIDPGDILVADGDGAVVVPAARWDEVAAMAGRIDRMERGHRRGRPRRSHARTGARPPCAATTRSGPGRTTHERPCPRTVRSLRNRCRSGPPSCSRSGPAPDCAAPPSPCRKPGVAISCCTTRCSRPIVERKRGGVDSKT
ncbi:hypothetical protein [Streptomyces sp. V4I23]|uniref:hypothetical protein n=1 Tax=Streptomyces sp. V4I23 TaxID=3042282 RepID=UPI00358FDDA7